MSGGALSVGSLPSGMAAALGSAPTGAENAAVSQLGASVLNTPINIAGASSLPAGMAPAVGSAPTSAELAAGASGNPAIGISQMPTWARGLLGALTGDSAYGQNAPGVHKALTGLLQSGQGKSTAGAPAAAPRRAASGGSVSGITSYTGVTPTTGNVTVPNFQQGSIQGAIQSLAPWMLGTGRG